MAKKNKDGEAEKSGFTQKTEQPPRMLPADSAKEPVFKDYASI